MSNSATNFSAFFTLLLTIVLLACTKDEGAKLTASDTQSVSGFLMSGDGLIITLLTDEEDDETSYFDSYVFNFNADGRVVASDGSSTVNGMYRVFRDDGRVELIMDFPDTNNFEELDDDWYFISIDRNTIRFNDDGDRLEFKKR